MYKEAKKDAALPLHLAMMMAHQKDARFVASIFAM